MSSVLTATRMENVLLVIFLIMLYINIKHIIFAIIVNWKASTNDVFNVIKTC